MCDYAVESRRIVSEEWYILTLGTEETCRYTAYGLTTAGLPGVFRVVELGRDGQANRVLPQWENPNHKGGV